MKRYCCFHHQDFWTKYFFFLWYDDVYSAEGHKAEDICVKQSCKKLYLKILMRETCLGLFNIEEFYRGCSFGGFWWNFKDIKPTCNTNQNLCMTFTNILGFLLNFSTTWKSCVKEQWPKKSIFDLTLWFVTRGQKEGGISFGPWNHDRWLSQQIRRWSSKQSKLTFWNQLHPEIAFLCRFWTPVTCRQTIQFWHQVSKQFWKLWSTRFFGDQVKGGSEFCIKGWKFFQWERLLCGWLAGPSPSVLSSNQRTVEIKKISWGQFNENL